MQSRKRGTTWLCGFKKEKSLESSLRNYEQVKVSLCVGGERT
jgi:hypothetical protein